MPELQEENDEESRQMSGFFRRYSRLRLLLAGPFGFLLAVRFRRFALWLDDLLDQIRTLANLGDLAW